MASEESQPSSNYEQDIDSVPGSITDTSRDVNCEDTVLTDTPDVKPHSKGGIFGGLTGLMSPLTPSAIAMKPAGTKDDRPPSKSAIVMELVRCAQDLTEDQVAEFKECFSLFDGDGSGTVDTSELGEVMRSLGQKMSDEDLEKMIQEVDADGSGTVDFAEFLGMMAKQMRDHDTDLVLRRAFDLFATYDAQSGEEKIPVANLQIVFAVLCEAMTKEEIISLTTQAAGNNNSALTYEQFSKLLQDTEGEVEGEV